MRPGITGHWADTGMPMRRYGCLWGRNRVRQNLASRLNTVQSHKNTQTMAAIPIALKTQQSTFMAPPGHHMTATALLRARRPCHLPWLHPFLASDAAQQFFNAGTAALRDGTAVLRDGMAALPDGTAACCVQAFAVRD